jgi:hypothetical protein
MMTAEQVAQLTQLPFYLDWKFWLAAVSLTVSVVAIILSQLPPLRVLFRRGKLDIEAYSRMALTHKIGNPIAQMHLIISNAGPREVKVKGIELHFQRDTEDRFPLPAQTYLQPPSGSDAVLLTSFKIKPDEEWEHDVNFFGLPSRKEEKEYRQFEANLTRDIAEKRKALADQNDIVSADQENVQPLIKSFDEKFRWFSGEYYLTLQIQTEPAKASISKQYRITLFESDYEALKDSCDDYKYGWGVFLPSQRSALFVPLTEA